MAGEARDGTTREMVEHNVKCILCSMDNPIRRDLVMLLWMRTVRVSMFAKLFGKVSAGSYCAYFLCLVSLASVLTSCAPSRAKVLVVRRTPADTWVSYQKASSVRDYVGMLQCIHPSQRARYSHYYALVRGYNRELKRLEGAIAQRIGDSEARLFRDGVRDGVVGAPVEEPECNYDILSSDVAGGDATIVVIEKGDDVSRSSVTVDVKQADDGEWFLVDYEGGSPTRDQLALYRAFVRACKRDIQDCIRKVNDGRVTAENYSAFLYDLTGTAVGSALKEPSM